MGDPRANQAIYSKYSANTIAANNTKIIDNLKEKYTTINYQNRKLNLNSERELQLRTVDTEKFINKLKQNTEFRFNSVLNKYSEHNNWLKQMKSVLDGQILNRAADY